MKPPWLVYRNHLGVNLTLGAAGYKNSSHHRRNLFSISWLSFLFGELILRWVSSHGGKMPASGFQGHILLASNLALES